MIKKIVYIVIVFLSVIFTRLHAFRESSRPRHERTVVCYVGSWAQYRPGKGLFGIEHIHPEYCTHLIYSFAGLNVTTWTIRSLDPWADLEDNYGKGGYKKMTALRSHYPGLKVTLAIGGWNEGSANYSALVSSPQRRNIFVSSVINFLTNYGFDGLDLDWEFPAKRGGVPQDRENFVSLIKELHHVLKSKNLLLTAAISADKATIDAAYNVPEISRYLDFIHVMAYDYHGAWDKKVGANAPLTCSEDQLCIEETIDYLFKLGAPADKLVLGLPMYGRTFIIKSSLNDTQSPFGVESLNVGFQGNYTREDGFMGYNEICKELITYPSSWRRGWDEKTSAAYAIYKDKVVIYDDAKSLKNKIEFVKKMSLAGVMIWSVDTDDFLGECASLHQDFLDPLSGVDYPLMRVINLALGETSNGNDNNDKGSNNDISEPGLASWNMSNVFVLIFSAAFAMISFYSFV